MQGMRLGLLLRRYHNLSRWSSGKTAPTWSCSLKITPLPTEASDAPALDESGWPLKPCTPKLPPLLNAEVEALLLESLDEAEAVAE